MGALRLYHQPMSVFAPGCDCIICAVTTIWHSTTLGKEEEETAESNGDPAIASQQPGDSEGKVSANSWGNCLSVPQLPPVHKDSEISGVWIRDYLVTRSKNPLILVQMTWELIRLLEISTIPPQSTGSQASLVWAGEPRNPEHVSTSSFLPSVNLCLCHLLPDPILLRPQQLKGDAATPAEEPGTSIFLTVSGRASSAPSLNPPSPRRKHQVLSEQTKSQSNQNKDLVWRVLSANPKVEAGGRGG